MAHFVILALDKADSLPLRMATREAHLAFVAAHGSAVRAAGPLLDSAGAMKGSMFVIEVDDAEAARTFNQTDPYTLAGLFERVDIHPWRQTVGAPL